jgi:hypothetical protein
MIVVYEYEGMLMMVDHGSKQWSVAQDIVAAYVGRAFSASMTQGQFDGLQDYLLRRTKAGEYEQLS